MMTQNEYDYMFKILLIGNSAVGKSSLLMRFADDIFTDNFLPTIGVDFKIRTIETAGSIVKLQMWDTAGQEKFKTITSAYYKGAHGVIMVYDITDRKSFTDLQNWLSEVDKYSREDVVKILVGNKKDLESNREVSIEEANRFAESLGMKYLETSAKDGINIEETFTNLVVKMKQSMPKAKPVVRPCVPLRPLDNSGGKKSTCC